MVSDLSAAIFIVAIVVIVFFFGWSIKTKRLHLMNKLFLFLVSLYCIWVLALLGIKLTPEDNIGQLFVLDCVTTVGAYAAVTYLCIAIVFVKGYERMPRHCWLLFLGPVITTIVCATNPLHHLQYVVFAVKKSEIVFGPYVIVSGLYSYICLAASIILMIRFALRNRSKLYLKQCLLFSAGGVCPLVVSAVATLTTIDLPITATALSFIPILIFDGIAIYQLHFLDIQPIATQQVLDGISDCYMVLSDNGLVLSYNKPFEAVFASRYGIAESRYLKDCVGEEDVSKQTAIYNLITAVESCAATGSSISYEQAVMVSQGGETQKSYYITDVASLEAQGKTVGFVVIYKDITQLKKSMQQLQDSKSRMMEQERFAFLGQMMGGLAHNLKTPIMSISGCISATISLVDECKDSLGDPEVTEEDFREIYGEMESWFQKVQESCGYMSDIITAIKGQASQVGTFDDEPASFSLDELLKRTALLMRHELFSSGCTLKADMQDHGTIRLHGDINNLIQVLGNLISNAIYAQKQVGGGAITLGIRQDPEHLQLYVKDTGPGVPEEVRRRLFKEMVTSKGAMGTGLGLYISNAVVRGKFGGTMWIEDNPGGGAIFGVTIPFNPEPSKKSNEGGTAREKVQV